MFWNLGGPYSEVQCNIGNGHMGPPLPQQNGRPVKTLPSNNFVGERLKTKKDEIIKSHDMVNLVSNKP